MPLQRLHDLPPGPRVPDVVRAVVEIPKGSENKYEVDLETGWLRLDRPLYTASRYPGDYGFVPRTLADDGDALDVLVLVPQPTFSGCLIDGRVIGVFRMTDRGAQDDKILAVPDTDPVQKDVLDLDDLSPRLLREIEHFFLSYKLAEDAVVEGQGWRDAAGAREIVTRALEAFERGEHPR